MPITNNDCKLEDLSLFINIGRTKRKKRKKKTNPFCGVYYILQNNKLVLPACPITVDFICLLLPNHEVGGVTSAVWVSCQLSQIDGILLHVCAVLTLTGR